MLISDHVSDQAPSFGGCFTLGVASEQPFGFSRGVVKFEGLLARADGETLSIELLDERVTRFQLNDRTRSTADGTPGCVSHYGCRVGGG
jgi:hypothetical protein